MTKNFSLSEFQCKCGCTMPQDVESNIDKLATQLQLVRDFVSSPIRINSSYRCKQHNRSIGSKDTSQHVLGKAADITIDTFTPEEVYQIIINLRSNPFLLGTYFNGIGRYNTFTHVDIRDTDKLAQWDNRS